MPLITFPEGIAVAIEGVLLMLSGFAYGRLSKVDTLCVVVKEESISFSRHRR